MCIFPSLALVNNYCQAPYRCLLTPVLSRPLPIRRSSLISPLRMYSDMWSEPDPEQKKPVRDTFTSGFRYFYHMFTVFFPQVLSIFNLRFRVYSSRFYAFLPQVLSIFIPGFEYFPPGFKHSYPRY